MQRGTGPEFPPPRKRQAGVIFAHAPGEPRAVWTAPRARRFMYSPDGQAERTIPFEWPPTHRKHALDDYPPPSNVHITTRKAGVLLSMISPGDPGRGQAQAADKIRQIAFAVSQLRFRPTASGISLEFRICPTVSGKSPIPSKRPSFFAIPAGRIRVRVPPSNRLTTVPAIPRRSPRGTCGAVHILRFVVQFASKWHEAFHRRAGQADFLRDPCSTRIQIPI